MSEIEQEALTSKKKRRGTAEDATHIQCPPDDGTWKSDCSKEELDALEELKKHPASHDYSDKFGFTEPVAFNSLNMDLVRRMWAFTTPGARDKNGRGIFYLLPSNFEPRRYTTEEHRAFFVWLWENMFLETMDFHRNGLIIVEDMTRAGWRNFDYRSMKELIAIYQNHFPGRIKQIFFINPSSTIRLCIKAITILDNIERLKHFVEPTNLIERLGGTLPYDHIKWMEQMMRASAVASASKRNLTNTSSPSNSQQQQQQQQEEKKQKQKQSQSDVTSTSGTSNQIVPTSVIEINSAPSTTTNQTQNTTTNSVPLPNISEPSSVQVLQLPPEAMTPNSMRALHRSKQEDSSNSAVL